MLRKSPLKQALLTIIGASLVVPVAQAQLDEIVVIAQKREENIQDVPVSISVISDDLIKNANIVGLGDIAQYTPSLDFVQSANSSASTFQIRGIGTSVIGDGVEPSVSVVIDGVPLGRTGVALNDLADIDRVEILRGPQGTLFGKNATAGVINIVTQAPTDELTASGQVSYETQYDEWRLQGTVSGPISDTVGWRLTAFSNQRNESEVTNIFDNSDINTIDHIGVRGKLRIDASEDTTISLIAEYYKNDDECCIWTLRERSPNILVPPQALTAEQLRLIALDTLGTVGIQNYFLDPNNPEFIGITASEDNNKVNLNGDTFQENDTTAFSATVEQALGDFTFKSISSWRNWKNEDAVDADGLPDIDLTNFYSFLADQDPRVTIDPNSARPAQIRSTNDNDLTTVTQEFQILSPQGETFEYVVGFFYFYQDSDTQGTTLIEAAVPPLFESGGLAGVPFRGLNVQDSTYETNNFALFGQTTIGLSDNVDLIVGARVLYEELEATGVNRGTITASDPNFQPVLNGAIALGPENGGAAATQFLAFEPYDQFKAETDDWGFTGRLGLQHYVTDDLMWFTTASVGYKGQAIDNDQQTPLAFPDRESASSGILDPEIPYSLEVGIKSYWFDRTLLLNATIFHTWFDDFQEAVFDSTSNGFQFFNAGRLITRGIEIDLAHQPVDSFQWTMGLSYVDSEFDDFPQAGCSVTDLIENNQGCNASTDATAALLGPNQRTYDASGDKTGRAELTGSLTAEYTFPVANSVEGFVFGDVVYSDERNNSDLDPNTGTGEYTLLGARIGVRDFDGRYEVAIWGRNLTDEDYELITFDDAAYAGSYVQIPALGTQYGIELRGSL